MILQFTGRSGAGKTTLAFLLKQKLDDLQVPCEVIDGDVYRRTLCRDLGFSAEDRAENIRRLAKVAANYEKAGRLAIISAINPFEAIRLEVEKKYGALTVWIDCGLPVLLQRDTKGLYKRALLPIGDPGHLAGLCGADDLYETPEFPALQLCTDRCSPEETLKRLFEFYVQADKRNASSSSKRSEAERR